MDLGFTIPSFDLTGLISSSWIYVAVIVLFGFLLIAGVMVFLFFMSYSRKIVLFENISGQGYQPVLKTRARLVKLGVSGEELLKTLKGGTYVSAYGRKMGKNTFWYAKGSDGYWYNIILGDLDSKMAMLDIDPIDRDVRMFHVALDRLSHQTYGKESWLSKHSVHLLLFVFLCVMIFGFWLIVGRVGEATAPLEKSNEMSIKTLEIVERVMGKADAVLRSLGKIPDTITINNTGGSGLVPAT